MARRRQRFFKQIARVESENIGHTGGWNNLFYLKKQQGQMTSAYVDKIRISWIAQSVTDSAPSEEGDFPLQKNLGILFTLGTKDTSISDDTLISASAGRGNGGVVTLEAKRTIKDNEFDDTTGFGQLQVGCQTTNPDLFNGDYTLYLVAEAWGRWHEIVTN